VCVCVTNSMQQLVQRRGSSQCFTAPLSKLWEEVDGRGRGAVCLPVHPQQHALPPWTPTAAHSASLCRHSAPQGDSLLQVLDWAPELLQLVLSQACPEAPLSQPGVPQHKAPPAAGCSMTRRGTAEQRLALGCLQLLLSGCGPQVLQRCAQSPLELIQRLQACCWRHTQDAPMLRELVPVLQACTVALLPRLSQLPSEAGLHGVSNTPGLEMPVQHAMQRTHGDGDRQLHLQHPSLVPDCSTTPELARIINPGDAATALNTCVRLLLVQLPGSTSVPLLIRGLAMEAGLAACRAALLSPCSTGSAMLCHLWGPVCAEALLLPPLTLPPCPPAPHEGVAGQGAAATTAAAPLQQHQTRLVTHLIPQLAGMQELRDRIVVAAAELVTLALQVCAEGMCQLCDAAPCSAVCCLTVASCVNGSGGFQPRQVGVEHVLALAWSPRTTPLAQPLFHAVAAAARRNGCCCPHPSPV
jgi:hypothetical protein